jgi:hypothetical protein
MAVPGSNPYRVRRFERMQPLDPLGVRAGIEFDDFIIKLRSIEGLATSPVIA